MRKARLSREAREAREARVARETQLVSNCSVSVVGLRENGSGFQGVACHSDVGWKKKIKSGHDGHAKRIKGNA